MAQLHVIPILGVIIKTLLRNQVSILFVVLMSASIYLLYQGYIDVKSTHDTSTRLIDEQLSKRSYIAAMYSSARERSILLLQMMSEEDPFELDDLDQAMAEQARTFIIARQNLTNMQLNAQEQEILRKQNEMTSINAPLQDHVADLLMEGQREKARQLLYEEAIPSQGSILEAIDQFISFNEANTIKTVSRIDNDFIEAGKKFQILGSVLLGASALFILFTIHLSWREQNRLRVMLEEQKRISDQLDQTAEQLSYQASHDSLTGLLSRREFETRLTQILQRADDDDTHFVLYLDLDQFKIVNDTCGHNAGDALLQEISVLIHNCVRKSDALARLGGDEFGILLEYCDEAHAINVATTIIETVNDFRFNWENKTFRVGVSIGLTLLNKYSTSPEDILRQVDSACFAAKDAGRNRYHVYHEGDKELQQRHADMNWVMKLERALEQDQFTLYAQQISCITDTGAPQPNYEVLIRLRSDEGKIIPPGAFLPAAERYNKMISIDRWVVQKVIELLSQNEPMLSSIGYISVNISCQSITNTPFLNFLIDQFSAYPDIAEKVCIEITETAAINSMLVAVRSISILRGMGVRFALDDFGSGLSSFGYLKSLPIDYLKIDGMFVKDILTDPIDRAMVKAIHEIASLMDKETVAEFVENQEILNELRNIGINYAQGYGVRQPEPLTGILNAYR